MKEALLKRVHREFMEVLESINEGRVHHDGDDFHEILRDIEAALAQPEQEPVGKWLGKEVEWTENPYKFKQGQPLYTTPPQRKPLPPELEDNSGYNSIQCAAYRAGWENAEVAHGIKETTE